MKKLLAIAVLALSLNCSADGQEEKCLELYEKYRKLDLLATDDARAKLEIERGREEELREAGCIK